MNRQTTQNPTTRVWIEDGCIRCHWCQHLVPEVFLDSPGGCQIRGTARADGITDENRIAKLPLAPGTVDGATDTYLTFVADGCPAQVIKLSRDDGPQVGDSLHH